MFCVYVIVNKINGKIYVGCSERSLDVRLRRHFIKSNENSNCSLSKAIRKYGKDNFDIRMIEKYKSKEEMLNGEIEWIAYLDTYRSSYGYNDTIGGEGGDTNSGKNFDNKWKVNISKAQAGKERTISRRFSDDIEKEICRLYREEKRSTYKLGKQFNCYRSVVNNILKRNNVPIRQSNYIGHSNGRNIFTADQEMKICDLYLLGNITRADLAKQFNCGKTTIREILLRNKIKL